MMCPTMITEGKVTSNSKAGLITPPLEPEHMITLTPKREESVIKGEKDENHDDYLQQTP